MAAGQFLHKLVLFLKSIFSSTLFFGLQKTSSFKTKNITLSPFSWSFGHEPAVPTTAVPQFKHSVSNGLGNIRVFKASTGLE